MALVTMPNCSLQHQLDASTSMKRPTSPGSRLPTYIRVSEVEVDDATAARLQTSAIMCCSVRSMKRKTQQTGSYRRCEECDVKILRKNWSRHLRAHGTYQLGQAPRGRPRAWCERSQNPDTVESDLDVFAVTRKVARRLYVLNCLGVPDYAQDVIVHYEFPILSAREHRIS